MDHNSTYPSMPDTSFNRQKQAEAMEAQVTERVQAIQMVFPKLKQCTMDTPVTTIMDLIEEVIRACGGEQKAQFLDVSRDFIKLQSRVPYEANLFPFLPPGDKRDNPRFHNQIVKMITQIPCVHGVRIVPQERSIFILVSIIRGCNCQ